MPELLNNKESMDQILDLLKQINIPQLIILFSLGWFFCRRLELKLDKIAAKFEKPS
jgi:hypothetical protein